MYYFCEVIAGTKTVSYTHLDVYKRQGLNDDVEALDKALDAYNAKTGYDIPIHVDAASGGFIPVSYTHLEYRMKHSHPLEFYLVFLFSL